MAERVLVTGGAGFIGSHLVDALLTQGYDVRVLDNLEPQVHGGLRERGEWPVYLSRDCERVCGDIRDRDAVCRALDGIEVVFHQAAVMGIGKSMYAAEHYVDVNVRGTAVLLDVLTSERHRVRKLIVASSMSIYGEGKYICSAHGVVYPRLRLVEQLSQRDWEVHCPHCGNQVRPLPTDEEKPLHSTSVYAVTKKSEEEMCLLLGQAYGLPTVALRYFNVYGSRQSLSNPYTGVAAIFSSRILHGRPPVVYEDGLQSRDFVHVSDVVQANLLALTHDQMDGGVFNVGTGRALTVLQVARTLVDCLDGGVEPEITHQFRAGDIRHCVADVSRIERLGYRAAVPFETGMAELVEWVRSQSAEDGFEEASLELARRGLTV